MAKFIMRTLNTASAEEEQKYYPHLLSTGETTLDDMARNIAEASSFTPGDVKGVVASLVREIAWAAARGRTVKVEGLGAFRATLGLRRFVENELADGKTHRNATSVEINGFNFRPSRVIVSEANRNATLERQMPRKGAKPAPAYTLEERMELARQYLSTHRWMKVSAYASLCRLSAASASKELRALAAREDAFLKSEGSGSHKVYVLRADA
ncbi:MAG: DNA-binding protein [Alloprevotella sp.]|nr:DNA-binding protein [Alloprevotella sp.]